MGHHGDSFVVRERATWWLTGIDDGAPRPIDLAALRDHLGAPRRTPEGGAAVSAHAHLRPTWAWVGQLTPAGVHVQGHGAHDLHLDATDLAILDGLGATGGSLEEVADRAGLALREVVSRAPGLVDAGCAEIDPGAPAPAASEGEPASEAEPASAGDRAADVATPRRRPLSSLRRLDLRRHRAPRPRTVLDGPTGPATPAPDPGPAGPDADAPDPRIPLLAVWHRETGPMLALGLLTAAARHHDHGALEQRYRIHRPLEADAVLAELADGQGPAVLLCSDYVWTLEANLALARRARELRPEIVIVHGGPSCPTYEGDAVEFLRRHGDAADVLVRGEGEATLVELLGALAAAPGTLDRTTLGPIAGITFVDPASGEVVRTADRERIADLTTLPSPYLTGEFDDIDIAEFGLRILVVETNRGCPYGCTFCDWGSNTMSRIRKFDDGRVRAEIDWATERGVETLILSDANFGIMSRDVETARHIAAAKRRTGHPNLCVFYPAKNTTRHLIRIMDVLADADLPTGTSISLQTTDEDTLSAIRRSNIATEHFVGLAAALRRRGRPVAGDLMVGLPGQTVESFRRDLQFMFDHEIQARTWPTSLLPNAPMNDPDYRREWAIEVDEDGYVVATSTHDRRDGHRLRMLRRAWVITEHMGLLRHLLRFLQWDHGREATAVMLRLADVATDRPADYPLLGWLFRHFHLFATAPVGWTALYDEVARFVRDELAVDDPTTATVLRLQHALMPEPGRRFPDTIRLDHDYVSYYRGATGSLFVSGHPGRPDRPLHDHPPADFTVAGDPLGLCDGVWLDSASEQRSLMEDFFYRAEWMNELASPLTRVLTQVAASGMWAPYLGPPEARALLEAERAERSGTEAPSGSVTAERVELRARRRPTERSGTIDGADREVRGAIDVP